MIRINEATLAAFQPLASTAFKRRLAVDLRERYPEETRSQSAAQLERFIERGLETARRYGLTWESTLAAFVSLSLVIGPRFHEHPAVRRILEEPDDTPDQRLLRLPAMVADEVWFEAKARDWSPQ